MSSFGVQGLDGLKRAMKELPDNLRNKVALEILKKAAVPIRDDARANAPVAEGRLKKNIYIARARDSTKTNPLVVVRVRRKGKKDSPMNAFYWLFLEFGTRFMAAFPFLRPAFEKNKQAALNIIKNMTKEEIAKSVRRVSAYTRKFAK